MSHLLHIPHGHLPIPFETSDVHDMTPPRTHPLARNLRRASTAIVAACLWTLPAAASRPSEAPFLFVRDADTGEVLFEREADSPRPIASLTKLMTAMVFLDQDPDLDRIVTLGPQHMLTPIVWKTPWSEGMEARLGDLLACALAASDNIAAVALAVESGLPWDVFVGRMNERAHELGMADAAFGNVTGLADHNVATAREIAILVEAAAGYPEIVAACGRRSITAAAGEGREPVQLGATNRLLWDSYWSVIVGKTGYTRLAGYCLALQADAASGPRLTMVILGTPLNGQRFREVGRIGRWLQERFPTP